jgi:hypothetical protein
MLLHESVLGALCSSDLSGFCSYQSLFARTAHELQKSEVETASRLENGGLPNEKFFVLPMKSRLGATRKRR